MLARLLDKMFGKKTKNIEIKKTEIKKNDITRIYKHGVDWDKIRKITEKNTAEWLSYFKKLNLPQERCSCHKNVGLIPCWYRDRYGYFDLTFVCASCFDRTRKYFDDFLINLCEKEELAEHMHSRNKQCVVCNDPYNLMVEKYPVCYKHADINIIKLRYSEKCSFCEQTAVFYGESKSLDEIKHYFDDPNDLPEYIYNHHFNDKNDIKFACAGGCPWHLRTATDIVGEKGKMYTQSMLKTYAGKL